MEFDLAVWPRYGVGSEVMTKALKVLEAMGARFGHSFNLNEGLVGGVTGDTLDKALSYEPFHIIVEYAKAELEAPIILNKPRPNWRGEQYGI